MALIFLRKQAQQHFDESIELKQPRRVIDRRRVRCDIPTPNYRSRQKATGMNIQAQTENSTLRQKLVDLLGSDAVDTSAESLNYFSIDLMWSNLLAHAIVRPRSVTDLQTLVHFANDTGYKLMPRGGGISYTAGYVPQTVDSIMVDLTALDSIIEINESDMYVTVQAGCTWKTLYDALSAKGLRTPYFGPVSGIHATVGGTLSQGSMFFGSGTYGPVAESVLSVKVILGDGGEIVTGSRANRGGIPFNRYFGPDLTGLFLSDTGAFGIKAEATLRLIKKPAATAYASFGFETFDQLYRAQSEIARHRIVAECFALDPFLGGKRTNLKSWQEGVKTLTNVARNSGLTDAVKVAAGGTRFLDEANFSMHLTADGMDQADADRKMALVEKIALTEGQRLKSSIPKILRAQPFQHVGDYLLGEGGLRWIPIHANLPISKVPEAHRRTMAYLEENAEKLESLGIKWGFSTSIAGTDMIFEPQFFWPDEITEFHRRYLTKEKIQEYDANPACPTAREAVETVMREISDIYLELGAVHQQIGRFYRYSEALDERNTKLLQGLHQLLDPNSTINPGSLGIVGNDG